MSVRHDVSQTTRLSHWSVIAAEWLIHEYEMLVSSAYMVTFVLCNAQGKSFMHIKNSSGPRHDPCGTPQFTFAIFVECPLTLQHCLPSCKYDLIQLLSPHSIMTKLLNENYMIYSIKGFLQINKHYRRKESFIKIMIPVITTFQQARQS